MSAYAVGSAANGGILYSDGSIKFPATGSIPASGQGTQYANNPTTHYANLNNTPPPAPTQQTSGGSSSGGSAPRGFDPTRDDINSAQWAEYRTHLENVAKREQEELNRQINEIYNPQESYLNQVESTLRGDVPKAEQEAQGNFDVNKQLLGSSKQTNLNQVAGEETTGARRKEDALQRARRIYQEQGIGSQQRFGGASSAGQAASELLTRNLQSEQGQTQRQFQDFMANIGRVKQEIETKFQDGVLQLQQNLQVAKNQIQRDFQNKLMEINNNRAQLASAKAQARMQALMDLRNKTFALQQQNQQFMQALALQKQQDTAGVEKAMSQISGTAQQGSQYAQNISTSGAKPLAYNYNTGGQTPGGNQPYIGYAQSLGSREEDPLNSVGSIRPSTRNQYGFNV